MIAIYLNAGLDFNGNSRRLFLVLDDTSIVEALKDDGSGHAGLHKKYPGLYIAAEIETTFKQFKALLKQHAKE